LMDRVFAVPEQRTLSFYLSTANGG